MKRFQMITEADARVLEYGSTVMLVAGGHVTPLALDTLKERRVAIVRNFVMTACLSGVPGIAFATLPQKSSTPSIFAALARSSGRWKV